MGSIKSTCGLIRDDALGQAGPVALSFLYPLARRLMEFLRLALRGSEALVALLHEDATLTMPPFELWLRGTDQIGRFLASMQDQGGRDRVVPLAANGCPAVAVYRPSSQSGQLDAFGVHVLECAGGQIAAIHAFLDPGLFAAFGLPLVSRAQPASGSSHSHATTFPASASCTDGCTPSAATTDQPRRQQS